MRYEEPMKKVAISLFFLLSLTAVAVEVAPRISDREIVESLAGLKAGQQALGQRFEQMQTATDQRFEQMQRAMHQRFDSSDQRFEQMHSTMIAIFSGLGALIIALFGYVVWDRRTALKPLEERFNLLEQDLVQDLQLRNDNGSLLTRFVQAMRELAQEDAKVARVMKTFSLM